MSPWAPWVGSPVEGPARCTSTTTQGVSVQMARPIFSSIRLNPGPDVAVMLLTPAQDAPTMEAMAAISSSIWMNVPPTSGSRPEICSAISVAGVMGYPPKKRQPAASAPSAQATSPVMKCSPVRTAGLMLSPFRAPPLLELWWGLPPNRWQTQGI